jgi:hypothetical protein
VIIISDAGDAAREKARLDAEKTKTKKPKVQDKN